MMVGGIRDVGKSLREPGVLQPGPKLGHCSTMITDDDCRCEADQRR